MAVMTVVLMVVLMVGMTVAMVMVMRMRVTLIETALTEHLASNVLKVSCSPSHSILIFYKGICCQ